MKCQGRWFSLCQNPHIHLRIQDVIIRSRHKTLIQLVTVRIFYTNVEKYFRSFKNSKHSCVKWNDLVMFSHTPTWYSIASRVWLTGACKLNFDTGRLVVTSTNLYCCVWRRATNVNLRKYYHHGDLRPQSRTSKIRKTDFPARSWFSYRHFKFD